jgi:hypothetical protein
MKLDLKAGIAELIASVNGAGKAKHPIADTGEYDALKEAAIRDLATRIGYYAEHGPTFDPSGDYKCDDCCLREEPKACEFVSGKISMQAGSCMLWIFGDQVNLPAGQKLTQIEAGYAERPKEKGFGCHRCTWSAEAKKADAEGRPSWCSWWGMHIIPFACCFREEGKDSIDAPGE